MDSDLCTKVSCYSNLRLLRIHPISPPLLLPSMHCLLPWSALLLAITFQISLILHASSEDTLFLHCLHPASGPTHLLCGRSAVHLQQQAQRRPSLSVTVHARLPHTSSARSTQNSGSAKAEKMSGHPRQLIQIHALSEVTGRAYAPANARQSLPPSSRPGAFFPRLKQGRKSSRWRGQGDGLPLGTRRHETRAHRRP